MGKRIDLVGMVFGRLTVICRQGVTSTTQRYGSAVVVVAMRRTLTGQAYAMA